MGFKEKDMQRKKLRPLPRGDEPNIFMYETFVMDDNRPLTNTEIKYSKLSGAYPQLVKINCQERTTTMKK